MTSSFEPAAKGLQPEPGFAPEPLPDRVVDFAPAEVMDPVEDPAEAQARLAEALRNAYAEGHAAGRAELPWSEAETLTATCAALDRAGRDFEVLARDYLRAQRRGVVELALALARGILDAELEADPEALLRVVERARAELGEGDVVVTLARRDLAVLSAGEPAPLERLVREGMRFESDPGLAPGDSRVACGDAEVDARVEALLAPAREVLLDLADADPTAPGGTAAPSFDPAELAEPEESS